MGTPLCIAAMSSNIEMIIALLGRDASLTDTVDPEACFIACGSIFGMNHKPDFGTLIWLALTIYQSRLDEWPVKTVWEELDDSERIITRLLSAGIDESAETYWNA